MGSMSNPNTWSPYDAYKDCSQQICSIYCPQWCYMIFPPPPPPSDYSASNLSPLIIALIGILASAFLLISYYAVISKYCKRRDNDGDHQNQNHQLGSNGDPTAQDQWRVGQGGLDELIIKSITVCKYRKGDGLVEGTECAVCLSEFGEDENLRLLPNCSHAFHLPCIDTWLKSHSNCPLCRSTAAFSDTPPPPPAEQITSATNVSSPETQIRDDVVVLVEDPDMGSQESPVASAVAGVRDSGGGGREIVSKNGSGIGDVGVRDFRRSISLGSIPSKRKLLIVDILRMGEEEEGGGERDENRGENSRRDGDCGMKRSVSTGRVMFVNKGKISIIPT